MRLQTLLLSTLLVVACGDDDDGALPSPLDAGTMMDASSLAGDASVDAAVSSDCFPMPKTYLEIINACTDADKIAKKPVLPLLKPDGTLPPLP